MTRAEIQVTEENLWFLERYLNVFDFLELFPLDALSSDTGPGVPVTFKTDLGFDFETDIDREKMQLRNRSRHKGWIKWITAHGLNLGDRIVIEGSGERVFSLRLEPKQTVSD
jgi:hypothetical protein